MTTAKRQPGSRTQLRKVVWSVVAGVTVIVALVLIGLSWWTRLQDRQDQALDRQTADALAHSRRLTPMYHAAQKASDSLRQRVQDDRRAIRVTQGHADSLQRLADSLAVASDSGAAYLARTKEADSLRMVVLGTQGLVLYAEHERDIWKALSDSAYNRCQAPLTAGCKPGVIQDLEIALEAEHDARQCRILFLPCPSRATVAAVTAIVTAVVATVVLKESDTDSRESSLGVRQVVR